MTDDNKELVEIVARALDPWAFSEPYGPGKALGQDQARDKARAVLDVIEASGRKIVPVEPTEEMLEAGVYAVDDFLHGANATAPSSTETERHCWAAMLSASPKVTDRAALSQTEEGKA